MGVPLLSNDIAFGLISLARYSRTPFTQDERDIGDSFAQRISKTLGEELKSLQEQVSNRCVSRRTGLEITHCDSVSEPTLLLLILNLQ